MHRRTRLVYTNISLSSSALNTWLPHLFFLLIQLSPEPEEKPHSLGFLD